MYIIHPQIKQKCKEIKILKNFNFPFYLILISFLFIPSKIKAQNFFPVSHETGYYEMDSLFFEVFQGTWDPDLYELQWSVNRFTEQSFVPYTDGVWLKDRSYTENTWENVHMEGSGDGSISPIAFIGTGINTVSVIGSNTQIDEMRLRLEVKENHPNGDIFDAYVYTPTGLQLLQSIQPATELSGPPYLLDTGDGWMVQFGQGFGHTVGDSWEWTVSGLGSDKECQYPSDFTQPRGQLLKVNTIRMRLIEKSTGRIAQQEVSIIGFGKQPHGHHILFATADSSDVIDVLSAQEGDDIRRNVYLHIMDPLGKIEFAGKVEWDKAAGSSSCLPNTGVAFKARGSIGAKNMTSSIYGIPNEKIDKIKMRVGGSGQGGAFSSHEVAVQVLQTTQLELLGGVKNSIATWYLNGSYWSLGFPQEQPRKRFYGRVLGVDEDEVDVMRQIDLNIHFDSIKIGYRNDTFGYFVFFDKEILEQNNTFGYPIFVPIEKDQVNEMVRLNLFPDKNLTIAGFMRDGIGVSLKSNLEKIFNEKQPIYKSLNIDAWSAYISIIHFLNMYDIIHNNNDLGSISVTQIFPIITDFDRIGISVESSNWSHVFLNPNSNESKIFHMVLDLIHSSPLAMSRLALVYQDLLNTALVPERTTAIVRDMRDKVLPHYEEYHLSWGGSPNGGATLQQQEQLYAQMEAFYQERPEHAFQLMADYVLHDEGFMLDDRNKVNIVFDSIPTGIVQVNFNSLTLYENFSGLYFPKPYVEFVFHGPAGISVREYPDLISGDTFKVSPDTILTFTLVMHGSDSVVSSVKDFRKSNVVLYPNPTQNILNIDVDFFQTPPHFVEIYDSMGVKSIMPLKQKAVDVSSLANGHYIIKIIDGENSYKGQFVKVK